MRLLASVSTSIAPVRHSERGQGPPLVEQHCRIGWRFIWYIRRQINQPFHQSVTLRRIKHQICEGQKNDWIDRVQHKEAVYVGPSIRG